MHLIYVKPWPSALRFDNLHTNEKLSVEYFAAGGYLPDALSAVNHLLRDAARSMRWGGVGYYAASDFVHVDTGRVRSW